MYANAYNLGWNSCVDAFFNNPIQTVLFIDYIFIYVFYLHIKIHVYISINIV